MNVYIPKKDLKELIPFLKLQVPILAKDLCQKDIVVAQLTPRRLVSYRKMQRRTTPKIITKELAMAKTLKLAAKRTELMLLAKELEIDLTKTLSIKIPRVTALL